MRAFPVYADNTTTTEATETQSDMAAEFRDSLSLWWTLNGKSPIPTC